MTGQSASSRPVARSGAGRGLGAFAAIAATCALSAGAAIGAERTIAGEGFALRFDDSLWAEQRAAPPSLVTLRCVAPACSPGNVVTFVRDERPLIAPGAGAFGPGAATGAGIDIRVQSLTPGFRVLSRRPAMPVRTANYEGYRVLYDIEDRALAKTAAAVALLRMPHSSLEVRMAAPQLTKADLAAFDRLLDGLHLEN